MSAAEELRGLSVDDLLAREKGLRHELFNFRFQHATQQLENVMRIREVRRTIARVKTVLREQTLGQRTEMERA